jgi:hypothetical protein
MTNLITTFKTNLSVTEDGIMISSNQLTKLKFKPYVKKKIEFDSKRIPLNIYGNKNNFKLLEK